MEIATHEANGKFTQQNMENSYYCYHYFFALLSSLFPSVSIIFICPPYPYSGTVVQSTTGDFLFTNTHKDYYLLTRFLTS